MKGKLEPEYYLIEQSQVHSPFYEIYKGAADKHV